MVECVLGELFIRKRMLEQAQVEQALSAQVSYGGRIGTNLVEIGHLTLDQVAQGLSLQHGVPMATTDAFESITSAVLGSVPREVCARFNVIPLKVVDSTLHVAMMDPQHLTLVSRLGDSVGMTIQPYASPQLRLLYYLERHYQIRRPERYLRIPLPDHAVEGDRRSYLVPNIGGYARTGPALPRIDARGTGPSLPRVRGAEGDQKRKGVAKPAATTKPDSGVRRLAKLSQTSGSGPILVDSPPVEPPPPPPPDDDEVEELEAELVMLDDRSEPPPIGRGSDPDLDFEVLVEEDEAADEEEEQRAPEASAEAVDEVRVHRTRAGMLTLPEALSRIDRASSRQVLLKQLIHPVLEETVLNLVLLVRGEVAIALGAWGTDLAPASVRALALPLGMDSLINRAYQERVVVRAPAMGCRLQKMIAVYFRNALPVEACVTPICFDGKVVNLVCAHSNQSFSEDAVEQMRSLASRAEEAYKRLVDTLRHKPEPAK